MTLKILIGLVCSEPKLVKIVGYVCIDFDFNFESFGGL